MPLRIAAVSAILLTAGCFNPETVVGQQAIAPTQAVIDQVQIGVKARLKHPDSAQFRNIRVEKRTFDSGRVITLACGQVNAKNLFGKFVGFKVFRGELYPTQFVPHNLDQNVKNFESRKTCG